MKRDDPVVQWLLASEDPSVRYFTLVDLLDCRERSDEVRAAQGRVRSGPRVRALLAGQDDNGGFGVHPYKKWMGAHWRLVSLVELGVKGDEPHAVLAAGQVLDWLTDESHLSRIAVIDGVTRAHASQEGNALAVCSRLGMTDEPRVRKLAESLVRWQWPDGARTPPEGAQAPHVLEGVRQAGHSVCHRGC